MSNLLNCENCSKAVRVVFKNGMSVLGCRHRKGCAFKKRDPNVPIPEEPAIEYD